MVVKNSQEGFSCFFEESLAILASSKCRKLHLLISSRLGSKICLFRAESVAKDELSFSLESR